MTSQPVSDDSPGTVLFPEYATLYDLIDAEVRDLTDEQLDFRSDEWGWADWSIRVQLSHMASLIPRWLVLRLGDTLFPDGDHGVDDANAIANSDFDRRMDDNKYHALSVILGKLKECWVSTSAFRNSTTESPMAVDEQSPPYWCQSDRRPHESRDAVRSRHATHLL